MFLQDPAREGDHTGFPVQGSVGAFAVAWRHQFSWGLLRFARRRATKYLKMVLQARTGPVHVTQAGGIGMQFLFPTLLSKERQTTRRGRSLVQSGRGAKQ